MKVKEWLKNNWENTLYTGVFSFMITLVLSFIWGFFISVIKNEAFWNSLLSIFSQDVKMPVWLIIIIITLLFSSIFFKMRKFKEPKIMNKKCFKTDKSQNGIEDSIKGNEIVKADQKINITLNSNFLGSKAGIFSIWAHVSDVHNENSNRYMYIVGYATKKGVEQKTPGYATYPNAWAINRIRPHDKCPKGKWRFWCNNAGTEQIRIDYDEIIQSGWHLFTVAWSERSNYIKFIIDKNEIGQRDFEHWPSDFSENVRIGTWPNMAPGHFFDSRIGPWRFVKSEFDMRIIEDYFKNKPE